MKRQMRRSIETRPFPRTQPMSGGNGSRYNNCLGALYGTYIKVHVPAADMPRYRSRKSENATNVLGVCTLDMPFIYVLAGWEGSAADGRVLRDAITRRNGLKVSQGNITK
ncbi:hypothetical protein Pint_16045 [Pistacia integerrima]|uniref:Uncharacterized protein n=1 Tax=Pistacia integerrima TaxID=434235 RepID=A0ACC0Z938_9ROSI|nr:hypothetical protein Pint_16045 [Pistacia integerrima]